MTSSPNNSGMPLISLCRGATSASSYPQPGWIDEGGVCRPDPTLRDTYTKEHDQHRGNQVDEDTLAQGIASSLRTLVIASFRAPPNKYVLGESSVQFGHNLWPTKDPSLLGDLGS